jgi:hypothetical protein
LCKDFSSLPKSTTKKTNYANKPHLPVRQAKAFCRTRHACSALLPCLLGTKNGVLGVFGTDILHSTKARPLIIKAMPTGKRTAFSPASHTSAENKPFSTTQNNEKA